jgi:hypothetical protein
MEPVATVNPITLAGPAAPSFVIFGIKTLKPVTVLSSLSTSIFNKLECF